MGMDMVAIMAHNYNIKEISTLCEEINRWNEINEQFNKIGNSISIKELNASLSSSFDFSNEALIISYFDNTETFPDDYIEIKCNFGNFYVFKNTLTISLNYYHKYGNLYSFTHRNPILELFRMIAKKLNSQKIIYCVDSYSSTYILREKASEGLKLQEIEDFGLTNFGPIPKGLTEAVHNLFFIDDFNLDLNDFNEDNFIFNRSNEEYFLENKYGQNFIIKRT